MPRVKFTHVVSFSSEDPDHPAKNLLASEVSKKKWLCSTWEPSCSVVLQLERVVEISAVHIGVQHAALVEVLGGLSERPQDPFQVVVPRCVLVPAAESRRGGAAARVRSFARHELAAEARGRRCDRVRVVCSQPYNKHCQYGLSFIHIDEPERAAPAVALPRRLFNVDACSSDEEEFRPGELFATRRAAAPITTTTTTTPAAAAAAAAAAGQPAPTTTCGQIRRATARACRGAVDAADAAAAVGALRKTAIGAARPAPPAPPAPSPQPARRPPTGSGGGAGAAKRPRGPAAADDEAGAAEWDAEAAGAAHAHPGAVLRGAALALSGYAGARRAALREAALALGARYCADWTPACTHLVCAFPNTPKLRAARAAGPVRAVTGEWLEECLRRARRLPWRWYATLPAERRAEPPPAEAPPRGDGRRSLPVSPSEICAVHVDETVNLPGPSDEDTDDEIERALRVARLERDGSPAAAAADASAGSDVAFVCDERFRGHVTLDSDDDDAPTDDEAGAEQRRERVDRTKALADPFEGCTFLIAEAAGGAGRGRALLARYVRAYGGLVLQAQEVRPDTRVQYVVGAGEGGAAAGAGAAQRVPARWVWRRHRRAARARRAA